MIERIVNYRERVFQVWVYTVGMGRLLLRSTKRMWFSKQEVDRLWTSIPNASRVLLNVTTLRRAWMLRGPGHGIRPRWGRLL